MAKPQRQPIPPPLPPPPEGPEALTLARAGIRALARIGEYWELSVDQQRHLLGGMAKTTYYGILKGDGHSVSRDTLERLSLLMGIWGNLEILVPDPRAALGWLRRPHGDPRFAGQAPMAWILQGSVASLVDLRRYLEAWRFGR